MPRSTPTDRQTEKIARRVVELLGRRGRLDESFYTVGTLAAKLSVTTRTVRNMLSRGVIPSYKVGSSRRIDPADVDRYLAQARQHGFRLDVDEDDD